jgi:hypothetical protein
MAVDAGFGDERPDREELAERPDREELASSVRCLLDRAAIIDLINRYSYYTDHRMHASVADLFTEDCVVDYGPTFGPPIKSRGALLAMYAGQSGDEPHFVASSHHNANILVTFEDANRARVRTSLFVWHLTRDGKSPELWGYYYDTVERGTGGWRFARRELRVAGAREFPGEFLPLAFGEEP